MYIIYIYIYIYILYKFKKRALTCRYGNELCAIEDTRRFQIKLVQATPVGIRHHGIPLLRD